MLIQRQQCDQCLFSRNRIVSNERAADIIRGCVEKDTYFQCHKTQVKGSSQDVCCRGFWDKFKNRFNLGRIAQRLNIVKEVDI